MEHQMPLSTFFSISTLVFDKKRTVHLNWKMWIIDWNQRCIQTDFFSNQIADVSPKYWMWLMCSNEVDGHKHGANRTDPIRLSQQFHVANDTIAMTIRFYCLPFDGIMVQIMVIAMRRLNRSSKRISIFRYRSHLLDTDCWFDWTMSVQATVLKYSMLIHCG